MRTLESAKLAQKERDSILEASWALEMKRVFCGKTATLDNARHFG